MDPVIKNIIEFVNEFDRKNGYEQYKKQLSIFQGNNTHEYRTILNTTNDGHVLSNNGINADNDDAYKKFLCKKMFFDKMTEMVSKEVCFRDSNQLYIARFQYLVNTVYNNSIAKYINEKNAGGAKLNDYDILFLYKGGTTMKILYEKYKRELSNHVELTNFFTNTEKYFERSDSDYSIYINPAISIQTHNIEYYDVYRDLNIMSCANLDIVRMIIEINANQIVDFSLLTEDIIKNKAHNLNELVQNVKSSNTNCNDYANIDKIMGITSNDQTYMIENIPDMTFDDVDQTLFVDETETLKKKEMKAFIKNKKVGSRKKDFYMTFVDRTNKYYKEFNVKRNIYMSINETNEYTNKKTVATFSLHRLKINFIVYYRTMNGKYGLFNSPSELVDVSILKGDATGLALFYHHYDLEQKSYKYVYDNKIDNTQIQVVYRGYTIYGHINDLLFTLFDVSDFPWEDIKYSKRIKRAFMFMFLELCVSFNNNTKLIKSIVNQIYNFIDTRDIDKAKSMSKDLAIIFGNLHNGNKMAFHNFFVKMHNIYRNPKFGTNVDKYIKMCNEIKELLSELIEVRNIKLTDSSIYSPVENIPMLGGKIIF